MTKGNFFEPIVTGTANLFGAVGNSISVVFSEIWNFLFFNIIAPLLIIVFVILFFWGQLKLIQLYALLGVAVYKKVLGLLMALPENEQFKKVMKHFNQTIDEIK